MWPGLSSRPWLHDATRRFVLAAPARCSLGREESERVSCLSGCLNGRGQARAEDGRADRALLRQMEGIYTGIPVRAPEASASVQALYQEWLGGADSPRAREALHTAHQGPGRPASGRDIKW